MFRPLPMPAIDNIALHVDDVKIAAGHDIFQQGDRADSFYVIAEGEADVIGDGRVVRTLDCGNGFGEVALLQSTLRTATVRARTRCVCTASIAVTSVRRSAATRRADAPRTL